jgi:hypothetical protein
MKTFQANLLVLGLSVTLFQGCVTAKRVKAFLWLNNSAIPSDVCTREPSLYDYGFYRKLNNGKLEFVSFCDKQANEFLAIHKTDFNNLMDEAYGKK